ncbi:Modification methylase DpnIIB [bacterium YEK0313]|nr:Modification methylase DpnIIB [bacterium YEK0313]
MSVRVLHGDMRDRLAEVPDGSVDLIFTDPPYGETSLRWDQRVPGWPDLVRPKLKPGGSMWVFGSLRMFMECAGDFEGWRQSHDVVWEKHNGTGLFNDRFRRVHEHAVHFYRRADRWRDVYKSPQTTNDARARRVKKSPKPSHWKNATGATEYCSVEGGPRLMRSVIYARSEHMRADHPTQKPLLITEPLLLYGCPPGGHVLDPFAGSGTTGVMARRHGMSATLIEGDEKFIPVIERRLEQDAPLLFAAREVAA